MDGMSQVTERLQPWAEEEGVRLQWSDGLLRLERGGIARAVVTFPPDFWEDFVALGAAEQEVVMDEINHAVWLQFDPDWSAAEAKEIAAPTAEVRGQKRSA